MPDITNPEAIVFANTVVRPLAELIRGLKARTDSALITWYAGLSAQFANDSDYSLADGREDEGVSRLTGADVHSVVAQLANLKYQLEQSGVPQVIAKPCVRALEAN